MIDENEDIGSIVKCIMEDGFESGLAESFYDKDRFMSYLDEKYDNQYNKITNNGENVLMNSLTVIKTSMRIFFMMLCWAMMKMIMKKNFKVKC